MAAPNPDAENDTPDELPDAAVEARWADIVARLEHPEGPREDPAPGTSTEPTEPTEPAEPTEPTEPTTPPARAISTGPRDWPTTPEVEALEEAESHFTPPEPAPVLSRDPMLTLAWAVAVGVPILTVVLVVVQSAVPTWRMPTWLGPAGGALFLGAVAALLWRMPHRRDPEDDDTGAAV